MIIERDRINPCPQFDQIFGTDSEEVGIGYPTQFAQMLNAIRLHYGFEGWLINFENRFFDVHVYLNPSNVLSRLPIDESFKGFYIS